MTKAKILCLHGFGTNANFMKKQAVSIQKLLSRQAQLIYVDAPFQAPQNFVVDQKVIDLIEGVHRSWFPTKINMEDFREEYMQQLQRLRESFEKASDHYDGIMGFSQGTVMLHFLLRLKQSGVINWKILDGIKFSINMNGNHVKNSLFDNQEKQIQLPSLHIISPQDFLYPKSVLHTTQYKDPIIISHSYGHKFPKLGLSESKTLINFIRKYGGTVQRKKAEYQILGMSSL